MTPADGNPNMALLEVVAAALGPVRERLVFVGGCAAGLLLTQQRSERIRVTKDVDLVVRALTHTEFHSVGQEMRARGFTNDIRPEAPICRWVREGITVDLMPAVKDILGFANRWYPLAMDTAGKISLPSGTQIRLIAAPVFIATKLEAFKDRGRTADGQPDFLGSHDLEDIITVIDRRPGLIDECRAAPPQLRDYLASEFSDMFANREFAASVAGHLPGDSASQARLGGLIRSLRAFTQLAH